MHVVVFFVKSLYNFLINSFAT